MWLADVPSLEGYQDHAGPPLLEVAIDTAAWPLSKDPAKTSTAAGCNLAQRTAEMLKGAAVDQLPPELRDQARKEKYSQGGFRYDSAADKEHIRAQRAAVWAWFRGLGKNLIKHGVNLTKVPLPVELCEPRSFLQRLTDSWGYLDLLHAAAAAADPAERLKLVMAFAVGGMRQQCSCDKPFNPILGETLQGVYPCGCCVYVEQISHHPPVSCWQVIDHAGQFQFTGSSCWSATFTGNSVKGTQSGKSCVHFYQDDAKVTWTLPTIYIRGVLFGDRAVKYHDTIAFEDRKHGLRCELQIDPAAPKKGLVRRIINKARHPRHKHSHDQLLGELLLCEAGAQTGVRSSMRPGSAVQLHSSSGSKGNQFQDDDDDAASLGCHSIGSFNSTTSSSSSGEEGRPRPEPAVMQELQITADYNNGMKLNSNAAASTVPSRLPAPEPACGTGSRVPAPLLLAGDESSTTLSSLDAAGHRSGRGIGVVKKLWSVKSSKIFETILTRFSKPLSLKILQDDDPTLLPSDWRF
eukprot:gene1175-1512_t